MDHMRVRIMAIFIDDAEQMTYYKITKKYEKSFDPNVDKNMIRKEVYALCKMDCLIEVNPEWDILSDQMLSHSEFGELDPKDFTFMIDEFLTIGPKAFEFLDENIVSLRSAAAEGGLTSAVSILQRVRVDSSQWTGLPKKVNLSGQNLDNMIQILRRADQKIDEASLTNTQAAQAKAYIHSALIIAEAPKPETDLLWEILQRGAAMSSIGQLFVAIVKIFTG